MKKGALVEYMSAFEVGVPNVVIFQYNPETLRHVWSQAATASGQSGSNPLAVTGEPGETFSFSVSLDVTDQLADPDLAVRAMAKSFGIHPRLAALEMLLFPTASGPPLPASAGESRPTPSAQVPTVLFVWGAARIVPVRVTSLTITEKLYDEDLNPTHADAQIELRVLTPSELRSVSGPLGPIASGAYHYTQGLRVAGAVANLGDAARAVIGMLP